MSAAPDTWGYRFRDRVAAVANRRARHLGESLALHADASAREVEHACKLLGVATFPHALVEYAWRELCEGLDDDAHWYFRCPVCDMTGDIADHFQTWSEDPNDDSEATHVECERCNHSGVYVDFLKGA